MQVRNSVTLIGNVGQTPTLKTLANDTRLAEFTFATNDIYRNREGEKVQRTEWHRVKAFGKVAEVIERYVEKGTALAISGSIRYNKWTDKHEQSRVTAEIVLSEFSFIGGREQSSYRSDDEEARSSTMQVAEPAPSKTTKRRNKKAAAEVTPAEDLPF